MREGEKKRKRERGWECENCCYERGREKEKESGSERDVAMREVEGER